MISEQEVKEKRTYNVQSIIEGYNKGDTECSYLFARLLLDGHVKVKEQDNEELALSILYNLSIDGHVLSRTVLNRYCSTRYESEYSSKYNQRAASKGSKGLVDFDGKLIKIDRKGPLTPVDVSLDWIDGKNVLNISFNLNFEYIADLNISQELFEKKVYDGIMEWQGDYTVFGGQQVSVRINISEESKLYDRVLVVPVAGPIGETLGDVAAKINPKNGERIKNVIASNRSFATVGLGNWSVHSLRTIIILSEENFTNPDEIRIIARHEFGHVLGLGDLYYSPEDSLSGVEKGSYQELDSYYINDKFYDLVMCDPRGVISNNDIEMVILAFRENKMQEYQTNKKLKRISKALGKGN